MEEIAVKSLMSLLMRLLVLTSFQQVVMLLKVIFAHPRIHISLPLVVPVGPAKKESSEGTIFYIPYRQSQLKLGGEGSLSFSLSLFLLLSLSFSLFLSLSLSLSL